MAGILLHSPADVIRWLLVQVGQGSDPTVSPLGAWPVYKGVEPNSPDNVITVYATDSQDDGRLMTDGERQYHHGFQVRIRGQTDKSGFQKANAIAIALDSYVQGNVATPDGHVYQVTEITRKSDVLELGQDTPNTKRYLFTINGIAPIRLLS